MRRSIAIAVLMAVCFAMRIGLADEPVSSSRHANDVLRFSAHRGYQTALLEYEIGIGGQRLAVDVCRWSRRVFRADLGMSGTAEKRIVAIKSHLRRLSRIRRYTDISGRPSLGREIDYRYSEAETILVEESQRAGKGCPPEIGEKWRLQGEWRTTLAQRKKSGPGDTTLNISGGIAEFCYGDELEFSAFLVLSPVAKPTTVNLIYRDDDILVDLAGIYTLTADTLTICWQNSTKGRPKSFDAPDNDPSFRVFTFDRVKPRTERKDN